MDDQDFILRRGKWESNLGCRSEDEQWREIVVNRRRRRGSCGGAIVEVARESLTHAPELQS
jgi:hypothetical protein